MFPWPHGNRMIYPEFHKIQKAAGIKLDCPDSDLHDCNTECWYYGFHDIRRSFATTTGAELSPTELQAMMRHQAFATTQRDINDRERMKALSVDKLKVPTGLDRRRG